MDMLCHSLNANAPANRATVFYHGIVGPIRQTKDRATGQRATNKSIRAFHSRARLRREFTFVRSRLSALHGLGNGESITVINKYPGASSSLTVNLFFYLSPLFPLRVSVNTHDAKNTVVAVCLSIV